MEMRHIGIILALIGTAFLAFSLRVKRQHTGEMGKIVDRLKEGHDLIEITQTYIIRKWFWIGLILIAVGSLFQW